MKTFVKTAADLIVENSGWGDRVSHIQKELE